MKEREGPRWSFTSPFSSLMGGEVNEDGMKISWFTGAACCETFAPGVRQLAVHSSMTNPGDTMTHDASAAITCFAHACEYPVDQSASSLRLRCCLTSSWKPSQKRKQGRITMKMSEDDFFRILPMIKRRGGEVIAAYEIGYRAKDLTAVLSVAFAERSSRKIPVRLSKMAELLFCR